MNQNSQPVENDLSFEQSENDANDGKVVTDEEQPSLVSRLLVESADNTVTQAQSDQQAELAGGAGGHKNHPIALTIDGALNAIDGYLEAAFIAIPLINKKRRVSLKSYSRRLRKISSAVAIEDGPPASVVVKNPHVASELFGTVREIDRILSSNVIDATAKSLFIGVFSEYDAFMGSLLKAMYAAKPDLFRSIRREIALTELMEFDSLKSVMHDMLDKEIDTFRRKSYVEQFAELEAKFDIKLRAFTEWPQFVEITQRRNLMTHNDGRVSQQYLSVCQKEGVRLEASRKVHDKLELPGSYLVNTMFVISKTAFMLGHTLWRKVLPEQVQIADEALNSTIYELLHKKRWKSAAHFGRFGLQEPMVRRTTHLARRIRVVNTAIALVNLDQQAAAEVLLDQEDWSASIREFKLATAVLKGQHNEAAKIMQDIGKSGELVNQMAYHAWPLFNKFRDQPEFQAAYEAIYGVAFLQRISEEAQAKSDQIDKTI